MRRAALVSLLLGLVACSAPLEHARPGAGSSFPAPGAATALAGAWNGQWMTTGGARGAAEVIVTPTRQSGAVLGQFTLILGARSWTARRQGTLVDNAVRFELPDAGAILLRLEEPRRLTGEWRGSNAQLPASEGRLELTRVQ